MVQAEPTLNMLPEIWARDWKIQCHKQFVHVAATAAGAVNSGKYGHHTGEIAANINLQPVTDNQEWVLLTRSCVGRHVFVNDEGFGFAIDNALIHNHLGDILQRRQFVHAVQQRAFEDGA